MAVSYKEFVVRMTARNPSLTGLSTFLEKVESAGSQISSESIISYTEFNALGDASPSKKTNIDDLIVIIQNLSRQPPNATSVTTKGLVIAVENMHPTDAEALGSSLDVDPLFFCNHIFTSHGYLEKDCMPPLVGFPVSRLASQNFFNIHYQRVLDLGQESTLGPLKLPYKFTIPGNCPRTVRRLPALSGRLIGIARACCSVFKTDFENGTWICN